MKTDGDGPTSPVCEGCSTKLAAVILRDGRALCGGCALVAVMPLIASTSPKPRPIIQELMRS